MVFENDFGRASLVFSGMGWEIEVLVDDFVESGNCGILGNAITDDFIDQDTDTPRNEIERMGLLGRTPRP